MIPAYWILIIGLSPITIGVLYFVYILTTNWKQITADKAISINTERPISTIGFIAKVPLKDEPRDAYLIEEKHCSWRLGLGSCGRVAKSLQLKYVGDMLVIIQTCEDGDHKEFHYKISDIVGRITISYKSDS